MEAACACVQQNEPVLLTGETGEEQTSTSMFSHAPLSIILLYFSSMIVPQCIPRDR
jgi:midasin (ATPase involved in ribosome maturation)